VTIEPDDQVSGRAIDASVEALRDPTSGIFEHGHRQTSRLCGAGESLDGIVRRPPVGHEDLEVSVVILSSQITNELVDVLGLVPDRRNNGDLAHGLARDIVAC
jgi:hypothetical protein